MDKLKKEVLRRDQLIIEKFGELGLHTSIIFEDNNNFVKRKYHFNFVKDPNTEIMCIEFDFSVSKQEFEKYLNVKIEEVKEKIKETNM